MPEIVDQVGGAVHRVQNPAGAAPVQPRIVLLFAHELNFRGQGGQTLPQKLLHRQIHIGHIVCFALGPDAVDCGGIAQASTCFLYRLNRLFHQRLS